MDKKVTVLTPNGRRQNIKVTPNTTLLQILEETCEKHGFNSEEYCLKHHNKEVDMTQMYRFSGLPNNCLLEMEKTEKKRVMTNVDICIQLEDSTRAQGNFSPADNLWHVVEKLHPAEAASFNHPILIYMRQEVIGKDKMLSTSLKSLGILEGKALIRFFNKKAEDLKTQANVYIVPAVNKSDNVKDDDKPRSSRNIANTGGSGGFAITKDLVQSLKKTTVKSDQDNVSDSEEKLEIKTQKEEKQNYDWGTGVGRSLRNSEKKVEDFEEKFAEEDELDIDYIGERNALIYSLNNIRKEIEDIPDSFYDLTVNDLKLVLRDLRRIAAGRGDAPLLTEKLREMEDNKIMLNKLSTYKNCVIRIKFPDQHVLQGIFKPIDKMAEVASFVRKFLDRDDIKFHLYTIPPKVILPLDQTLLELNFVPTALIHFGCDNKDESVILKPDVVKRLTTIEVAIYAANKLRLQTLQIHNDKEVSDFEEFNQEPRINNPATGAIPKRPRNDGDREHTS